MNTLVVLIPWMRKDNTVLGVGEGNEGIKEPGLHSPEEEEGLSEYGSAGLGSGRGGAGLWERLLPLAQSWPRS